MGSKKKEEDGSGDGEDEAANKGDHDFGSGDISEFYHAVKILIQYNLS